ncbi:sigma-70 family RNA polymerase sigma factor [Nostoc sp. FACHB-87]|uniref:sigma-70 family RNA polymerase sigma factor n=1 Tax=Nostocales TaxID=1161 RepID=UPI0016833BB5|nr:MULTISPECIES: sigma-70 family RNA polymerase sigma factor [Nostocales]MBD2458887.1 sigma-70 family RNA polymerase sigma factor [Nostoc sp. FACHB-87]MBD2477527.1 sigma-70 family RNA polymerase sigma factor [Anabaena sp. FACHB-83]MBD2489554.1 sigma-70 family RNA polymerase sigma factor [Aulosira sp. FACHB-615]
MESLFTTTDVLLITKIVQKDQSALSALYDRYGKIIYAIAFKSLKSVEESEEVVLDVFAQVWRIAERYDTQKGRVDTWLFTIARSRILDRLRKLQRTHVSTTFSLDTTEIQPQADNIDLFESVFISERRSRVIAAMKKLPDEQRLVIELAYYRGLTQSQIAEATGVSLGTVKTRIRLGLKKLQSIFVTEEEF